MEIQSLQQDTFVYLVNVNQGCALRISLTLCDCQDLVSLQKCQARKPHLRLAKYFLLTILCRLLDDLVVERVNNEALVWTPNQVIVHTSEAVIAVDYLRLNHFAIIVIFY